MSRRSSAETTAARRGRRAGVGDEPLGDGHDRPGDRLRDPERARRTAWSRPGRPGGRQVRQPPSLTRRRAGHVDGHCHEQRARTPPRRRRQRLAARRRLVRRGSLVVPSSVTCVGARCTVPSLAPGTSVTRQLRHHRDGGRARRRTPSPSTPSRTTRNRPTTPRRPRCCVTGGVEEVVTPILECVDRLSDGTYRAHFGYLNQGNDSGRRADRRRNAFTPDPENRGQPVRFQPGRAPDVFQVDFQRHARVDAHRPDGDGERELATLRSDNGMAADRQDPGSGRRSGPVQPGDRRRSRRIRSRRRAPRDDRRRGGPRRATPGGRRRGARDVAGGLRHDDRLSRQPRARPGPVGLPRHGARRGRRGRARSRLHDREHPPHRAAGAAAPDRLRAHAASAAPARHVGPRGAEVRQPPYRALSARS